MNDKIDERNFYAKLNPHADLLKSATLLHLDWGLDAWIWIRALACALH